jgi:uncharacterized protein involved in exopolysaccharide biosynthesis
LAQQQKSPGSAAVNEQQGEGIQVIDPANLPVVPVAPKRMVLTLMGFVVGLGLGLCCRMVEILKPLTIKPARTQPA